MAWQRANKVIWNRIRPLVFINACHSVAILPNTLLSYLEAFVGTAHASGVIGTEVKVAQNLAIDAGEQFFRHFLGEGLSVDEALRRIRIDYLANGNVFGLVYTPYCWAELKVARA